MRYYYPANKTRFADTSMQNRELFPAFRLLEERLGVELFEEIPQKPGIYRFYDKSGNLLYVGKAKNLRIRLFSYKRATAGQVSRKVSRLISRIASIEFETTSSEQDALLLENHWIRTKRPPFNHANKQTEAYYFVYLHPDNKGLRFRLAMHIDPETDEQFWYGCYKGHFPVRSSMGFLLQLLWMAEYRISSPHDLPIQLTRRLVPMYFYLPWQPGSPILSGDVHSMLHDWMLGKSCNLLDWLTHQFESDSSYKLFRDRFLEHHIECLESFYNRTLLRYWQIRQELLTDHQRLISQNELDDLTVKLNIGH